MSSSKPLLSSSCHTLPPHRLHLSPPPERLHASVLDLETGLSMASAETLQIQKTNHRESPGKEQMSGNRLVSPSFLVLMSSQVPPK
jgi:hypothetical protein